MRNPCGYTFRHEWIHGTGSEIEWHFCPPRHGIFSRIPRPKSREKHGLLAVNVAEKEDVSSRQPEGIQQLHAGGGCAILTVLPMSSITRKLFTFDNCLRMAEAGALSPMERIELINGDILVVSPPGPRHGAAVDRAADEFREQLRGKALTRAQGAVVLDTHAAPLPTSHC